MKGCPSEETLSRFYDGEQNSQELREHIANCSECSSVLEEIRALEQDLLRPVGFPAPARPAWGRLAAACLVLLLAGWWWWPTVPPGGEKTYHLSSADGRDYTIKTTGEATLLSLEINETRAELEPEE